MAITNPNLLRGTLDLLILQSLRAGPLHGYAVSEWIESASDQSLLLEEGTLYPALHRLANKGWIRSEWGVSENNRRAKFYRLTQRGRRELKVQTVAWENYVVAMGKVLTAAGTA